MNHLPTNLFNYTIELYFIEIYFKMSKNIINSLLSSNKVMAEISKPLFNYLGAKNFGYLKIHLKDLKFYYNTTDDSLLLDYYNIVKNTCIFVREAHIEHINGKPFYFLTWPNQPNHYSMELYIKHQYWNGYTILSMGNGIIEMWWVIAEASNIPFSTFCHKNRCNLVKFIQHFQLRFDHLIPLDSKSLPGFEPATSNFILPEVNIVEDIEKDIFHCIFEEIPKYKKYTLSLPDKKIRISNKEIECLKLLSIGLTKKQIAKELDLSTRTVESHYNNLRVKTQLYLKSDLINIYNQYLKDFLD